MLLGKDSPAPAHYAPEILCPVPRAEARLALGIDPGALPFRGEDVWHAWELSWLGPAGTPCNAVARFTLPATTVNLVESKSLKLYLNSLAQTTFSDRRQLSETLRRDLGAVAEGPVGVDIFDLDSAELAITDMPGRCIDTAIPGPTAAAPAAELLQLEAAPGQSQVLYSHALRSLCPVTAQPDWATVVVWLDNALIDPGSLLRYVVAFRHHQEFHEQCVERMFCDIRSVCADAALDVLALYTRRGGLDINPWRSTRRDTGPRLRSARQ